MVDTLSNDRPDIITKERHTSSCIVEKNNAIPEAKDARLHLRSQTGVSLDYVHSSTKKWYVLRATYGREEKAARHLLELGKIVYLPIQVNTDLDESQECNKKILIPSVVFVYSDHDEITEIIRGKNRLPYLHFYYNRTEKNNFGKNDPLIIPTIEMDNFMRVAQIIGTRHVEKSDVSFKTGDLVKVTDGICKGIIGRVGRINRQTGVVVNLEGLCCLITTYIPKAFLTRIQE